jgi:hypothetical protein
MAFVDLIAITRQDPGMTKILSRLPEIWLSEMNLQCLVPSARPTARHHGAKNHDKRVRGWWRGGQVDMNAAATKRNP